MRATLAFIVASVFLAGVFAGCVQSNDDTQGSKKPAPHRQLTGIDPKVYVDKLSKIQFPEMLKEHIQVPSFDGKKMDSWLYRPKTNESTKVPVFINFSPYWSNLEAPAGSEGDAFGRYMIHEYVPRGYAVVLTSVRGTGYSEGCFNIGGETEKKDAVAVIDYYAKQPWSNGNVAAGGKSYDGTTPNGAVTKAPTALKAIFPVEGISELYKYNYKGGLPYTQGATFSTTYYAGESAIPKENQNTNPPAFMADRAACTDLPQETAYGVGSGVSGDGAPYWTERNYTKDAAKVTAAVFLVGGFSDWNVKPDNYVSWIDAIKAPKKVWLHYWTKTQKPGGDGHVYPMRDDWNTTMLRFLDQTLKGVDTGIFAEPNFQVEDNSGQWRWEETWPPARAVPTPLYLGNKGGGGVLDPAPVKSGTRSYQDNGQAPATGATSGPNLLAYQGAALTSDLHIAGIPIVHLQASSDRALGKVIVGLVDVGPSSSRVVDWGGLNFRHRLSIDNPQPVAPNTVYDLNFELFPQDIIVPAGHHLALTLAGNVNGAGSGGFGFQGQPTQETITILENDKSFVQLPLITDGDAESPQPLEIHCFAC